MNIKFDNYDIDLDVLNQDLAEYIPTYLDSKRWAKDPEARTKWNLAYDNINSRGITGFSTNNGRYSLSHNGLEFDDPEGYYADAANVIINRAKNILNTSKAKEVEPENLEEFGRFLDRLGAYIMNTNYGGDSNLMRRHWNSMDSHDEYELYETTKRKAALKKALQDYKATLEDNKYSFEGTSYKDLNDLKFKIDAAIASLDNPNNTDYTALHQLGIDENLWFPTNEEAANEARTAAEEKLELENKAKQAQEIALANQKRANQYTSYRFFNISKLNGTPPSGNDVETRLSGYASLPKLNAQQQSELVGAFKYAKKKGLLLNLDKDELSKFGDIYINNPTRLKKVKGINGFYYDSIGNRIIQPFQGTAPLLSLLDVVNENSPEALALKKLLEYLNSTEGGFTPAELREVAALLLDLGAAVDPEGVTSATLSQIAAGIRDFNRANDPEGWTWGDTGWAALDHGLGLVSAIPFVGGLIKGGWASAKLGSYIPKIEKWIRGFGRLGATAAMGMNASGALNTLLKIKNGEDLSLKDYLDLAYFFIGGLGHHLLNRGNRIERSAMKARGMETSNSLLNKAGITRTKVKETSTTQTTPTIKISKTNEKGKVETKEIPITKELKKVLKSSKSDKLDEAAKQAGVDIPKGYKIATSSTTNTWGRNKINSAKSFFGKGNSEIFGTTLTKTSENPLKSDEEFEQYLSQHNNTLLKKIFNGSNRDIRRYDRYLGNNIKPENNNSESPTENSSNTNLSTEQLNTNTYSYRRETMSRYKDATNGRFGNSPIESGSIKVGGNGDLKVELKDGTYNVYFKENKLGNVRNQAEVQKIVSNVIKQLNKKDSQFGKVSAKEMGEILRSLKAKGWLRHGGKLIKA